MLAKHDVAVRIGMILLPGLLYAMPAAAEGDRDSRESSPTDQSKLPQAPVGHRQPTAADSRRTCRKTRRISRARKRDRELDAKLRICRNC